MARVVAYVPDLLFGSNVLGMLRAAGHEVALCARADEARDQLPGAGVLLVDLTSDAGERAALVRDLREAGELQGTRTLAFYSHVEVETRRLAERSGFDQVVPRSRMAREGAALVGRLAEGA